MNKTVFLFPGNGIHQKNMLKRLSDTHKVMKIFLEDFAEVSSKFYDIPLLDETKDDICIDQIRIFASEAAIFHMWESYGCKADILIGNSLGEFAAAFCAGMFSAEDAVKLLVIRANILESSKNMLSMCSVPLSADSFLKLVENNSLDLDIAAYNAPKLVTAVGKNEQIEKLKKILKSEEISFNLIQVSGGSHCSFFEKERETFFEKTKDISINKPQIEIIPCIDTDIEFTDIKYWFEHMVRPVRFDRAVCKAVENDADMFVDLGVSPVLLGMAMNNTKKRGLHWTATIKGGLNYSRQIQEALESLRKYGKCLENKANIL